MYHNINFTHKVFFTPKEEKEILLRLLKSMLRFNAQFLSKKDGKYFLCREENSHYGTAIITHLAPANEEEIKIWETIQIIEKLWD